MKGDSAFPKAPELLVSHHQIRLFNVISRALMGDVLPLCRDAVNIFYSCSRLGCEWVLRWKLSGCTSSVLSGSVSRICSKQHTASSYSSSYSCFFFKLFITIIGVQLYNNTDMVITWKNSCFILSNWTDFHMVDDDLSVATHTVHNHMLVPLSGSLHK